MNNKTARTVSIILGAVMILFGIVDMILFIKSIVDVVKVDYLSYLEGIAFVSYLTSAIAFRYFVNALAFIIAGGLIIAGCRKMISIIPAVLMILFDIVYGLYSIISYVGMVINLGENWEYILPNMILNAVVGVCFLITEIVIVIFIIISIKKVAKFIPFIGLVPIATAFVASIAPIINAVYLGTKYGPGTVVYSGVIINFFVTLIPIIVWCVAIVVSYLAAAKE